MDLGGKRVAIDVDGKVTLAALDRLPASSPHSSLPASTVGTLRLSKRAAFGSALRPDRSRLSVEPLAKFLSPGSGEAGSVGCFRSPLHLEVGIHGFAVSHQRR